MVLFDAGRSHYFFLGIMTLLLQEYVSEIVAGSQDFALDQRSLQRWRRAAVIQSIYINAGDTGPNCHGRRFSVLHTPAVFLSQ